MTHAPPATKKISGIVSYLDSGLPLPGATVTPYAIDSTGARLATPLGGSGNFAISDVDGSYSLAIPSDYAGSILLEATVPASQTPKAARSAAATAVKTIRSLVPSTVVSLSDLPQVMISFATDAVMTFLEENVLSGNLAPGYAPTGLSPDNIRKATIVMETFFGPDFSQVPPPKSEADIANASRAQQDLLVSIRALNAVTTGSGTTMVQLVVEIATIGLGDLSNTIVNAITQVVTVTLSGVLPDSYQPNAAIVSDIQAAAAGPVAPPDLSDTTPPAVPAALAASALDSTSVSLTWNASSDSGTGVAGYALYRAVGTGDYALLQTLGKDGTSYLDKGLTPSTQYRYKVAAFDGARNSSAFSDPATVTTPQAGSAPVTPPASAGYAVSGRVTLGDAGLSGVLLAVSGTGSGSVVSGSDGSYTFEALDGSYLVTPVRQGYQFTPASRVVTVNGQAVSGVDFSATPDGTAIGTVSYPDGSTNGTITYPDGSTTSVVSYPNGVVIGGVSYPPGTVITSVSYPNGTVIAGVSYPAGTVISTVSYPAGAVIGGVSYPNGSVTTIVRYPAGAVVGGVSYPLGLIVTSVSYPGGAVIGGVSYPAGTVFTTVSYPSATVVGGVSYPAGTVVTSVSYPAGSVVGGISYPFGVIFGSASFPNGTVVTTVAYPGGAVVGGVSYPAGTIVSTINAPGGAVVGGVSYPNGTVVTSVTYPGGAVIGGVSYPAGTVLATALFPNGTVVLTQTYPNGAVIGGVSYPAGSLVTSFTTPGATVIGGVNYPSGVAVITVSYPDGRLTVGASFPNGAILGGVSYPAGAVVAITSYPNGSVSTSVSFPGGTVVTTTSYPNGTLTVHTSYPDGSVASSVTYPGGTATGNVAAPSGSLGNVVLSFP